jgi:hypothetical protein
MGGTALLIFFVFICIMRRPALSKADESRIIELLKAIGMDELFSLMNITQAGEEVDIDTFTAILVRLHASLGVVQIHQLYKKIDTDRSNGISRAEFKQYMYPRRKSIAGAVTSAKEAKDDADDKKEKIDEVNNRSMDLIDATGTESTINSNAIGGVFMKLKLLVGFGQVLSYYPLTFDSIPWPVDLVSLMNVMQLFSIDLFSIFGGASCELQTGFLNKFTIHMLLIPGILLILVSTFGLVYFMSKSSKVYTPESVSTGFYTLVSLILYTLYVGVSTRIFRLFKCREIMGVWYLTADYTVTCFEGAWSTTSIIAYMCMFVFVFGIPLFQFLVLCKNRKYLDENKLVTDSDYSKHLKVKQKYGSIFEAYTPECYYYDLIDLIRRLILTGGLILVGNEEAVGQVFLGILVNLVWFSLVVVRRPYKSVWDTALSGVLSFVLTITLVSGVCMRLYELTLDDTDVYQRNAFGVVLITSIVICLVLSIAAIIISTECLRDRVVRICQSKTSKKVEEKEQRKQSTAKVTPIQNGSNDLTGAHGTEELSNVLQEKLDGAGSPVAEYHHILMHEKEVDALHKEHEEHDKRLKQKHELQRRKSNARVQERLLARTAIRHSKTLQKTTIFQHLSSEAISKIIDLMDYRTFDANENLVVQGELGTEFMVIVKGSVNIVANQKVVNTLGGLDFLGEGALVHDDHYRGTTFLFHFYFIFFDILTF